MKRKLQEIGAFLGVLQNVETTEIPPGGVVVCQNMAQYLLGRIQRVPGISLFPLINVDGSVEIPLLQVVREPGGSGTANMNFAVYIGAANAVKFVNVSSAAALTGPALTATPLGTVWDYTFYAQQHLVVGKNNQIMQITSSTTYAAWSPTGSPFAAPEMIQSFLDRLYVVDNTNNEGLVQYSDALTKNFQALNIVNTREIPGPITALGIYVPSTGTMGIRSGLLIFKRNAIWVWDEASKDIISQKVGTRSPNTIQNTPAGVVFLGEKGNISSVFLIPPGLAGYGLYHFGEPIDIGKPLYHILNVVLGVTWYATGGLVATWAGATWSVSSGLTNPIFAHGVVDGKFYKMYFTTGANTQNNMEFWLDLDILTQNPGETREGREPQAIWYGPMTRGSFDSSAVGDDVNGPVILAMRGAANTQQIYQERVDATQDFLDVNGNVLPAVLDVPLNFPPREIIKIFGFMEIHMAPESHVAGNQISYVALSSEKVMQTGTQTVLDTDTDEIHLVIPLVEPGRVGLVGHHPRVQITHSLNMRFDVIGLVNEYWITDIPRIVPMIRS